MRILALEGHPLCLTHALLAVHAGLQRAALIQQHVQAAEQAVSADNLFLCGGVVPSQSPHRPAFRLGVHRVVEDQETCHDGFLGSSDAVRLRRFQTSLFGSDWLCHPLTEVTPPAVGEGGRGPAPLVIMPTNYATARKAYGLYTSLR